MFTIEKECQLVASPYLFKIKGVTRKCCRDPSDEDISVISLSLFIPKAWSLEIFVCYAASKNVQESSFQHNPRACEVASLGEGMHLKPDNWSWTQTHAHSWINAFKMGFTHTVQMVSRLQKGATRLLGGVPSWELLLVESGWDQARRAAGRIGTVEIWLGCIPQSLIWTWGPSSPVGQRGCCAEALSKPLLGKNRGSTLACQLAPAARGCRGRS